MFVEQPLALPGSAKHLREISFSEVREGLAEYVIIFNEILFCILARRPQTLYTNQVFQSCQIKRAKREKFEK